MLFRSKIIEEITNSKAKDLKDLIKQWKSKVKPNIPKVVEIVQPQLPLLNKIDKMKKPKKGEPPINRQKIQPTHRKGMIESRKSYMSPKSNSFIEKFVGFMNKILDFDPDGAAKAI